MFRTIQVTEVWYFFNRRNINVQYRKYVYVGIANEVHSAKVKKLNNR